MKETKAISLPIFHLNESLYFTTAIQIIFAHRFSYTKVSSQMIGLTQKKNLPDTINSLTLEF